MEGKGEREQVDEEDEENGKKKKKKNMARGERKGRKKIENKGVAKIKINL